MKQTKCYECWGLNGQHWQSCQTRGYGAVGPHPDAPKVEPSAPKADGPLEMCCGGTTVRAVCEYHGHQAQGRAAPVDRTIRREPTECGHYMRTWAGDQLIDEEPIECYVNPLTGLVEVPS